MSVENLPFFWHPEWERFHGHKLRVIHTMNLVNPDASIMFSSKLYTRMDPLIER